MAERRNTLSKACEHHKEAVIKPNAWEFVIDAHHSLVWCNVFKAASSAWIHNFNLLGELNYFQIIIIHNKQKIIIGIKEE